MAMNVDMHTPSLEKIRKRSVLGQHCVNLMSVLSEAAKDALHAAAGAINVCRVVDGKNFHVEEGRS